MIDTKPMDVEAVSFVKNKLLRYSFKIAEPSFDILGADLIILDSIENRYSKVLKIQSKGRTLKKTTSSIKINETYVDDDFIVFLYVIDEIDKEKEYLFVFVKEDILKWSKNKENYVLSFNRNNILEEKFQKKVFSKEIVTIINQKLFDSKIKKYTSVIIDKMFLTRAINQTIDSYKKIYPKKCFINPKIKDVLFNIESMYNRFKTEDNVINFHLFDYNELSTDFQKMDGSIDFSNGKENRIYNYETNDFIYEKIEEKIVNVVNVENIIFVGDDILYEYILNYLSSKGIDVIVIMNSENNGGRMYINHLWGDIVYPIAQSLGLERYEW